MSSLTLHDAQKRVDQWISQFEEGYFPPLVQIARLTEELGELSRAVSHETGVKKPKSGEPLHSSAEELGDLLFVLICFANMQNISLDEIFEKTMQKIETRDTPRWTLKKDFSHVQNEET
ncbi:MAG: nucleotide pyrophosphohydrolase [Proteobacteria bacterium]|nr:nucleotide pyrophosphohydrolase [Pseudomonadota bacterium]